MFERVSTAGIAAVALNGLLIVGSPDTAQAQGQYRACYIPEVGAVYRIGETGLPAECLEPTHVEFSWRDVDPGHLVTNLQGYAVSEAAPTDGQVLAWNNVAAHWEPFEAKRPIYVPNVYLRLSPGEAGEAIAECDVGDLGNGGGYALGNPYAEVSVWKNWPQSERTWKVGATNSATASGDVVVTVVIECLDYPPLR